MAPARRSLFCNFCKLRMDLNNYDKDNIPDELARRVQSCLAKNTVSMEGVKKCSSVVHACFTWVQAMMQYHKMTQKVAPHRQLLASLQKELVSLQKELVEVAEQLQASRAAMAAMAAVTTSTS